MRPAEELPIEGVRFIGEQDGEPERLLNQSLIAALESRVEVEQAFLARVVLEPGAQDSIALCL
jgi:hypothetical protein